MTDAGTDYLMAQIDSAIEINKTPSKETVCKAHEGMRQGIYALLIKAKSDLTNTNGSEVKEETYLAGLNFKDIFKIVLVKSPLYATLIILIICAYLYLTKQNVSLAEESPIPSVVVTK